MAKRLRHSDVARLTRRQGSVRHSGWFRLALAMEVLECRRLLTIAINEFGGTSSIVNPSAITSGPDQNLWFTESSTSSPAIGMITPSGAIQSFSMGLSEDSDPKGITSGPGQTLWFTEPGANKIGEITTDGTITEFSLPIANSDPDQIALGSDGALWFTEPGINAIGRITTTGTVSSYNLPTAGADPTGITAGPDGNLWFTESGLARIGTITTGGAITEYSGGITAGSDPVGITAGPDGNLWFTENATGKIGQITTAGVVTEFSNGITGGSGPLSIASGSNGALWFTEQNDDKVGEITTGGAVTEFPGPGLSTASLDGIASGQDGNLWFTENVGNHVDRITTAGVATQFPSATNVLTSDSNPTGITTGPDGALWFTQPGTGQIGRITTSGSITEYPIGTETNASPNGIALGPGGMNADLWVTNSGGSQFGEIDEINAQGVLVQAYLTPTAESVPEGITLDPVGDDLWFAENGTYTGTAGIGEITPAGTITEYRTGLNPGFHPQDIVAESDGNLWFTATSSTGGEIGEISNTGVILAQYAITNVGSDMSSPNGIVAGSSTTLWFTDAGNHAIGEISTSGGTPTEYFQGLTSTDIPAQITLGADGNLWFSDPSDAADPVGQITPQGSITLYPAPTSIAGEEGITSGPDNNIWFTELLGNQIGQLVLPQSIASVSPLTGTAVATVPRTVEVATFEDSSAATNAANFSATVSFGDTNPTTDIQVLPINGQPGYFEVLATHTFANPGTYNSLVTISTQTGSVAPVSGQITVVSPFTIVGNTVNGIVGTRTNTFVGTFTDSDPTATLADFSATVWWNDGSAYTPATIIDDNGTYDLYAGHVYAASGSITGTLMLVDTRNNTSLEAPFYAVIAASLSQTPINEVGPDQLTPGSTPTAITLGPEESLWFTESNTGYIGQITTSGVVNQYGPADIPTSDPSGITTGDDGDLWITEPGCNGIGQMTPAGVFTNYTYGISQDSGPTGITNGPDGNLWFTETTGNRIGRITQAGVVTEFSTGLPSGFDPVAITSGPDGNLWFVGTGSDEIGRITPQGVITLYRGATGSDLTSITLGSDGNLWFTEEGSSQIGKINPTTFQIGEFMGTAIVNPTSIIGGPAGPLYFVSASGDYVGSITTAGVSTGFLGDLTLNSSPQALAAAPDGNVYFTEASGDRIGQLVLPQNSLTSISFKAPNAVQGVTFTGSFGKFTEASTIPTTANFVTLINWGDGSQTELESSMGGQGSFSSDGTHEYLSYGTFYGTYEVFNAAGSMTADFTVQVAPAVTVAGVAIASEADRTISQVVATFTDASSTGSTNSYLTTINWGDGTVTTGSIATGQPRSVYGTHTYAAAGQYTVTTTVEIAQNVVIAGVGTSTATITPFVSVLNASGTAFNAVAGSSFTGQVAGFVNTDAAESSLPASDYAATIDWGDGSQSTSGLVLATSTTGSFQVQGSHIFASVGQFSVVVSISLIGQPDTATATSPATVAAAGSFVVTNILDSGPGSLRQAILNANAVGGHEITFAIPSGDLDAQGVATILPENPLPAILGATILDGNSQASFEQSAASPVPTTPLVQIDGQLLGGSLAGLVFSGNTGGGYVSDLAIYGFGGAQIELDSPGDVVWGSDIGLLANGTLPATPGQAAAASTAPPSPNFSANGILVQAPDAIIGGLGAGQGNVISGNAGQGIELLGATTTSVGIFGNLIGLDPTGSVGMGNGINGIAVLGGAGQEYIGPGNVISGNAGDGVVVLGGGTDLIAGNAIGTDRSVSRAISNGDDGVLVDQGATRVTIGGSGPDTTNFISGNGSVGIVIQGGSSRNSVEGNLIGTNLTGTAAIGNGIAGVLISDASGNVIGYGNLISGNGASAQGAGIWVDGPDSSDNLIFGNRIGTSLDGESAIPNAIIGVLINEASQNQIGGSGLEANQISGNSEIGVMVAGESATGNLILGNFIGTDATGRKAVPNGTGVYFENAPANTLGATTAGSGNVISGNSSDGVQIFGAGSAGDVLQGNLIGTDLTGTQALGNAGNGVLVNGAPGTTIFDDFIDSNLDNGVFVDGTASTGTSIRGTVIGQGASGQRLGNQLFGLLIGDGAATPAQAGVTNVNNALGPIRNTNLAPSTTTPSNKVGAARVSVKLKAESFGGRSLNQLQTRGTLKPRKQV